MSAHYKTKGFVLKKDDRGEADQFFTIYTQEFGQQKILAKGIRKLNSKLRREIPIFGLSEIEFVEGKVYKTLTGAFLIENYKNIKKDLNRLKIAYQISESFCGLIKPPQKDLQIWQLLNEIFHHLNNPALLIAHYSLLYYFFFWNLLSILGHKPELYECLICRKKLKPDKLYFSTQEGIICAPCCNKSKQEVIEAEPDVVKILREILKRNFSRFIKIKITKEHQNSLKEISNFYLSSKIF